MIYLWLAPYHVYSNCLIYQHCIRNTAILFYVALCISFLYEISLEAHATMYLVMLFFMTTWNDLF